MKNLPLISKDYNLFDWQANETTQRAYNALMSQGQSGEFAQSIWNDIVDKLYGALVEADLGWNNTYGEINDIKMSSPLDILTANRFNAVAYNIEQIINTSWKWSVDMTINGYLGRPRVYGFTQKGKDADIVYGWYLIELVRVLNVFLSILKNEANFGELVYQDSITTQDGGELALITSPVFSHERVVLSNDNVVLNPLEKLLLDIREIITSNDNATLLPVESLHISAQQYSESDSNAVITTKLPKAFQSEVIDESLKDSELLARQAGILNGLNKSLTNCQTNLIERIPAHLDSEIQSFTKQVVGLNKCIVGILSPTIGKSKTTLDASMNKGIAGRMSHSCNSKTLLDGNMLVKPSGYFDSQLLSQTLYKADALIIKPRYVTSGNISATNEHVELMSGRPKLTESHNIDLSNDLVNLSIPKVARYEAHNKSNTVDNVGMNSIPSKKLSTGLKSKTTTFAVLTFKEADWIYPVQNGTDLFVQQIYDGYQEDSNLYIDTEVWLPPIQNGTDLFIRQVYESSSDDDDTEIK